MAFTAIAVGASVVMGAMQAKSQREQADAAAQEGAAVKTAAYYEADQLDQQAGQERAAAQRQAMDSRRQERIIQSNLQAAAAASGGGATDPTIGRLSSDIAVEGQYRALSDLFRGEERARGLENQANARRYEGDIGYTAGRVRQRAGRNAAQASIIGGIGQGASLYSKYG
jgi:hypothetical protein